MVNSTTIKVVATCLTVLMAGIAFSQTNSSADAIKSVANKVIADTRFERKLVPQVPVLGVEIIDAGFLNGQNGTSVYAWRKATVEKDTVVKFGINSTAPVSVWINNKPVYQQAKAAGSLPVEMAYDQFRFENQFSAPLKKGTNDLLVKMMSGESKPVVFLRPINANGYLDSAVKFAPLTTDGGWLLTGPFPVESKDVPEQRLKENYQSNGKIFVWQSGPQRYLSQLVIDSRAAYQRDAYADWHYANGILAWSLLQLGNDLKEEKYRQFANDYTGYVLKNLDYFRFQYDSLFALRGSYHRIFRQTMLDDAGAPALPFAGLFLATKDTALQTIIRPVTNYILNHQVRLQDGTFCRPEPEAYTVWADDLFMSVPFLLQIAKATGDQRLYNEAAKQTINFHHYLWDADAGLYKHGWFSRTQGQSAVHWGRANGWIAWATAEVLAALPTSHSQYKIILKNFRQQMRSLLRYQAEDGMWHQVLNNPSSYEETSCTAMFTLAMARGVRAGWLPRSFVEAAQRGWKAVAAHITPEGVVKGICRGTEIGADETFYNERKTIDNDPRGLGAVLVAGLEISKLQ